MTFPDAYTKAQIEALCHRYEAACGLNFTTGADVVLTEDEAVVLRGQGYRWDDGAVVVTPMTLKRSVCPDFDRAGEGEYASHCWTCRDGEGPCPLSAGAQ